LAVEHVGRGEVSDVFSGTDTWTGELVAVRRLRDDRRHMSAEFRRMAERMFGLTSARFLRPIATGDDHDQRPYLVTELLFGRSVADFKRVRWEVGCEIARLGSLAVAELHMHGLLHGSLRPSRFFVTSKSEGNQRVKLLDLGSGDRAATAAKDRWALAAILFQLLMGRPPIPAGAGAERVLLESAPPIVAQHLSDWLAPDATATPADMAAALRELLDPTGAETGDRESVPIGELLVFPKSFIRLG
jgi:serine/threonine protein kinase